MNFWIHTVSPLGKVVVKFSEPIFEFAELNDRMIEVKFCNATTQC